MRGPTRVQHQMWLKWNNETLVILFWVVKGQRDPCDRSRRHACPCIGPASSLSIAIFTRAISLAFSNRIATVINQTSRGLLLRERGFRLGFVHDPPRPGGSGLYQNALILYHLTTAMGQGSVVRSVSESCAPNLNLQYKTPNLKRSKRGRVLR